MNDTETGALAIRARNLSKKASRGTVYGDVELDLPVGGMALVCGPDGSGKSSLLLTLVARMRPDRSSALEVLGHSLPLHRNWVQHRSAAVGIKGLDDLDEVVSVRATIRERLAWLAPWYRIVRAPSDEKIVELLSPWIPADRIPSGSAAIHELDEADNMLLKIALAMLDEPELLVVDEIDALHDPASRDAVWDCLVRIADSGVSVVASATNASEAHRAGLADRLHTINLAR